MTLEGKLAVVTGASRGIGKAIARALHAAGAEVIITGRHQETLEAAAKAIGERCHPYVCDQSDPEAITAMAMKIQLERGAPDILINNAGMMQSRPVGQIPLEMWDAVIATNLTGVFLVTQAFLQGMIGKEQGDIIMISSMSGKKGDPGASVYAASKFGVQGFAQSLMYEVRKHNIRVMVLNPSRVDTAEGVSATEDPRGHTLHADDLASTIVHLVTLPRRTMIRDMDIYGTNP